MTSIEFLSLCISTKKRERETFNLKTINKLDDKNYLIQMEKKKK